MSGRPVDSCRDVRCAEARGTAWRASYAAVPTRVAQCGIVSGMLQAVTAIVAPRANIASTRMDCHACRAITDVVGIYVVGAIARNGLGASSRVEGFLRYVTRLDDATALLLREIGAALRRDRPSTATRAYWMNHCALCDARFGDRFVFAAMGRGFYVARERKGVSFRSIPHCVHASGSCGLAGALLPDGVGEHA